ncbi:TetR/AcrR family transcriptional regulator [Agromyces sp. MMS24-K17]|uniref:TetR/AcrR family transcriptional regulator n=1 Tax=Agromyces sp. MMS24-K17 TaxID=3372850 RepID=UPI0037543225
MAWDTDRTKRLLLDAAIDEFSRWGLAGARVDRIAAAAGVNKERIYQYFGKKDDLFRAALAGELAAAREEVPMTGTGPEAVADYAGRLFDHHLANPRIARLVFWEGLELGAEPDRDPERAAYHDGKVDGFAAMLPGADRADAAELLLTLVTLIDGWPVLQQLDAYIAGGDGPDGRAAGRRRRAVVDTMRAMAAELTADAG